MMTSLGGLRIWGRMRWGGLSRATDHGNERQTTKTDRLSHDCCGTGHRFVWPVCTPDRKPAPGCPVRREGGRVADVRRRSWQHPLLAGRSDQRCELDKLQIAWRFKTDNLGPQLET